MSIATRFSARTGASALAQAAVRTGHRAHHRVLQVAAQLEFFIGIRQQPIGGHLTHIPDGQTRLP